MHSLEGMAQAKGSCAPVLCLVSCGGTCTAGVCVCDTLPP